MVSVNPNYQFLWLLVVVKNSLGKNVWFAVWVSLAIGAFAKVRIDPVPGYEPTKKTRGKK